MEIWDVPAQGRGELQTIIEATSKPNELFPIVDGAFLDLAVLTHCVCSDDSTGDEYDSDQLKLVEMRVSAIAAYCDSKTNIDAQPMLDQLQAVCYWMTHIRIARKRQRESEAGPDESVLLNRLRVLSGIEQRLKNHLYFIAGNTQRTAIEGEDRKRKSEDELVIEIGDQDHLSWIECSVEFCGAFPTPTEKSSESAEDRRKQADAFKKKYQRACAAKGRPAKPRQRTGRPKKSSD